MECATWLADAQVPFSLVFTKTDKRKKGVPAPQQNIEAFQVSLTKFLFVSSPQTHIPDMPSSLHYNGQPCQISDGWFAWQAALLTDFESLPAVFHTDSVTSKGQNELLSHIAQHRVLQAGV